MKTYKFKSRFVGAEKRPVKLKITDKDGSVSITPPLTLVSADRLTRYWEGLGRKVENEKI